MTLVLQAILEALAAFFRWWVRDLISLVPPQFWQLARWERHGLLLELGRTESALLTRTAEGERPLGTVPVAASDYHQRLKALVKRAKPRKPTLTVHLPQELGLRRTLDLPLAALSDLDQLFAFEMDRLTPFKLEEVHYGHRLLGTDRQARRISIELHVAPRCEVDRALRLARNLDVAATRIQLANATDRISGSVTLYFEQYRPGVWEKRLNRALAVVITVLAIAASLIPLERQLAAAADLESQIPASRAQAGPSLALQKLLDQLSARLQLLETVKSGRVTATEVLAELTQLLPDQAHLLQLSLRDGTVQLYGVAEDANNLIALLGNSSILVKPRFIAAITKDSQSGLEHFYISIGLSKMSDS
jgi:general secretion pathway protein L